MNYAWLSVLALAIGANAQSVYHVEAGSDLQYELQEKLITAAPGDVIELGEGLFRFDSELSVACDNLTIRGQGPGKTILSFKGQNVGSEGITVTGNGFVIEELAVEDTAGDAIKVLGSDGVIFRHVRVEWTNGPDSTNGAYGLYPVECSNVLIESCVAIGASDAGIYVGQSKNVIVRGCRAEYNVAGIEIENTKNADVYDCVATNNTGGLLVFDLPGLPAGNGHTTRVFRNRIFANNTQNFASPGNVVGMVPTGTGIMVMAADDVEVFGNDIRDNDTANMVVVSYFVTGRPITDEAYDPFPDRISIHDNVFDGGGEHPGGQFGMLLAQVLPLPLADILFGGIVAPTRAENVLRLERNIDASFANFDFGNLSPENVASGKYTPSFDDAPYHGHLESLRAVTLAAFPDPADGRHDAANAFLAAPRTLAAWGLFQGDAREQRPSKDVYGYELNTPLFSDYASKHRFFKVPTGTTVAYQEDGVLEFPKGTVIAKTFAYPSSEGERLVETRIQVLGRVGWHGFAYQWNDEQTDATLVLGGARDRGRSLDHSYEIPNANQCLNCHGQNDVFVPLGPTARNLNRDGQLEQWAAAGVLSGLPPSSSIASLAVWDDPSTGTLDDRARAWLEVNCAHCHNPIGAARTTGLDLTLEQQAPGRLGIMKTPIAAGRGSAGRSFDIVPGKPDESILLYRIESNEPSVRMPTLSRSLMHVEAVALIREWIEAMDAPLPE